MAASGWYPDPSNPAQYRYWDGDQWTEHVQPAPVEAQPAPPAQPAVTAAPAPPIVVESPAISEAYDDAPFTSGAESSVDADANDAYSTANASLGSDASPGANTVNPAYVAAARAEGGFGTPDTGGIYTELLTDTRYAEVGSGERVVRQNTRMLKVTLGPDVLARQGSMVAFQGAIDFDHEGSGAARFLKKAITGEGLPLMRCTGQGELFLADSGRQVHIIHLNDAGLSVNGRSVLAFEPSLDWDIERVQGASMLAGGLFNTRLRGTGWVAITTDGDPVVLRTDAPTFVDTDAVVAWSSGLTTSLNRTVKAKAFIGRGSGEAAQLAFSGTGIVIVQPSEGGVVPPHSH